MVPLHLSPFTGPPPLCLTCPSMTEFYVSGCSSWRISKCLAALPVVLCKMVRMGPYAERKQKPPFFLNRVKYPYHPGGVSAPSGGETRRAGDVVSNLWPKVVSGISLLENEESLMTVVILCQDKFLSVLVSTSGVP